MATQDCGIAAYAKLMQLAIRMGQRYVGHALVTVNRHQLRVKAGQATAESGEKTKTPGLMADRAHKASVPFVIIIAQRANQHGCAVSKGVYPVFACVFGFQQLIVHRASRGPDQRGLYWLYREASVRF
ncbi:hypothetical protein D3C79_823440 [compost metagenome]